MKKLLFVFNPHAGKGLIRNKLSDIVDIFTKGGYEVTIYPTQAPLDGFNKIKNDSSRFDVIVISGGDGTLSEAVNAMMQTEYKVPLGYIPAGSTNDFAASMEIPKKMNKAAELIVNGITFDYDVGEFNGNYYTYVAAFGAFTDISYNTPQNMKKIFGHSAYIANGLMHMPKYTGYDITVEHDCKDIPNNIQGNFILGLITNSTSIGGMKKFINKNSYFDDGLFEVTLIKKPSNPLALQSLLREAALNKPSDKHFIRFKASHLKITSDVDISWTLDGEAGGTHKEVEIINHKQAVSFII